MIGLEYCLLSDTAVFLKRISIPRSSEGRMSIFQVDFFCFSDAEELSFSNPIYSNTVVYNLNVSVMDDGLNAQLAR